MVEFLVENWKFIFVGYWVLEKIVKLTPTKYDDITLDIIYGALLKLVGKEPPKSRNV